MKNISHILIRYPGLWLLFIAALQAWPGSRLAAQRTLQAAEYYFDTDPGEGNGVPVQALDGSLDAALEALFKNGITLPGAGAHVLYVRAMDSEGNWSPSFRKVLYVTGATQNTTVQLGEAFLDSDPGEGNGIPLIAYDGNFNEALEVVTGFLSGFTQGPHVLHVRVQGVSGDWGPTFRTVLNITGPAQLPVVTAGEFFLDSDPGPGNGTPLLAFDGNFNYALEEVAGSGALSGVSQGPHVLHIRVQGTSGAWGPTFRTVLNISGPTQVPTVVAGEFFFDNDPGAGNGIPLLAFDGNFDQALETLSQNWNFLPDTGVHILAVRVKDVNNVWGPLFRKVIRITSCTSGTPPVVTISPAGTVYLCAGDNLTLTATPGFFAYTWFKGNAIVGSGPSYVANSSGQYKVHVMDINGCTGFSPTTTILDSLVTYYADADADGYGDLNNTIQACTMPSGYVANNTDCNDNNSTIFPGATELCDGLDNDCDTQVDDGALITFYADADGDTYGNPGLTQQGCTAPSGYVANNQDCNDANAAINPSATEICDGVDDDCNGVADNGVLLTFHPDSDNDGYGNPLINTQACSAPSGYVANNQ
ncbi:MAG: putative metal-binding motif-containing protein, partial [Flavobacteriales bacterium]|nr:putative metal-binding motif-containing protein [Flavobacteriales bacterium]